MNINYMHIFLTLLLKLNKEQDKITKKKTILQNRFFHY